MMKLTTQLIIVLISTFSFSQKTMSELLNLYNDKSVPYISVHELAMPKTQAFVLDARELKEYQTSHIKDAIFVGYREFNIETVLDQIRNKEDQIVVYCSIGIRSEDIAEKIENAGYKNVFNLYGGIFEWKNNDYPLYTPDKTITNNVHAFSKEWSQWLKKGNKIYE